MLKRIIRLAAAGIAALSLGCTWDDDASVQEASGSFVPLEPGVLTVAADVPSAGFWEGEDADDLNGGLEYELAQALAERFELDEVQVVNMPVGQILSAAAGDFDIALSQISVTDERQEVVDLSQPYFSTTVGVVSTPGLEVPDLAEARELTWGVVGGSTQEAMLDDQVNPEPDPVVYLTVSEALNGLRGGTVDAVLMDYARALAELSEGEGGGGEGELALVARVAVPQEYAVALPEGSPNDEAVSSAIRAMEADGTLEDLHDAFEDEFGDAAESDIPTIRVAP